MPFRFLDLQKEIRCIVYDLCLEVGTVYLATHSQSERSSRNYGERAATKPEWQLLQVCHLVRDEAAKVLFSKNHFVLGPAIAMNSPLFTVNEEGDEGEDEDEPEGQGGNSLNRLARLHLHSASIAMDMRLTYKSALQIANETRSILRVIEFQNPSEERMKESASFFYETHTVGAMSDCWKVMCHRLSGVGFLEIDITYAYNHSGHRRLLDEVAEALVRTFAHGRSKTLRILGTKTQKERMVITQKLLYAKLDLKRKKGGDTAKHLLQFKAFEIDEDPEADRHHLRNYGADAGQKDGEIDLGMAAEKFWSSLNIYSRLKVIGRLHMDEGGSPFEDADVGELEIEEACAEEEEARLREAENKKDVC